MYNSARLVCAAAFFVLSMLPATALSQTPSRARAEESPAKRLSGWLEDRGYMPAPILVNKAGWLDVKVEIEGLPMLLMLDTGANNLNLHRPSAERAKLPIRKVEETTAALGGVLETGITKISKMSIGGITSPAESYVVDLAPTNVLRKRFDEPPCDGVIGGSFLAYWSAIIDYPNSKLYLLDPTRKPTSPARLLKAAGYISIPLELNKSLTLDVKAEVNGKAMVLFIDTGARDTMSLDRSSAERAELAVKPNKNESVELGGTVASGFANVEKLAVGRYIRPAEAHVTDYSATNAARKAGGTGPCDGTLNGGLLKERSAIIDYLDRKLYLVTLREAPKH